MDVKNAIWNRRTVQKFAEASVPEGVIIEALEAALTAPNHRFTFPWHFVWVGKETRQKLAQLSWSIDEQKKGAPLSEEAKNTKASKILSPSELIVFCCKKSEDSFQTKEDYATVACAIQNFSLMLTSHGWGSKWATGEITTHPETYKLLEISPEEYEISGFVWVGKSAVEFSRMRRPELSDVLVRLP